MVCAVSGSATKPTACKALTTRKGHAASVRRQSRQRLRRERRYRRNRLVRFIGTLYEPEVPSRDCTPRALPRAARSGRHVGLRPPRNDKSGGYYRFIVNLFGSAVQRREGTARPLQGACGRRGRSVILGCAWRSLSAATYAIGACRFNGTLFQSFVQRRERHAAPLQGACGRRP